MVAKIAEEDAKEAKARSEKQVECPGVWRTIGGQPGSGGGETLAKDTRAFPASVCWICENGAFGGLIFEPLFWLFWLFWMLRWEEGQN